MQVPAHAHTRLGEQASGSSRCSHTCTCRAVDCTSYGKCHCLCSQCAVMVPGKRFSHRTFKTGRLSQGCFPRSHTSTHAHTHTIRAHTHPEGVEFYLWGSILCWPSQTLFLFFGGFFFPRTVMYALKDGEVGGVVSDLGCWVLQCSRVYLMYQCANREL